VEQPKDTVLDDLEVDALTELVNLGISQSATSLAEMVREEVTLSVPKVALVSRSCSKAISAGERCLSFPKRRVSSSSGP
jgi:chemotaxis protein CheC